MNRVADQNFQSLENSTSELYQSYQAIIESSDDAILSKDLNGTIRSWNAGATRIFGYTASETLGKSVTMLIPAGYQNEEPDILARIRRGEKIDHYETIRQRKDGSLINISLTVSPIKNARGEVVGASKIARDITVQKQIAEKLQSARQELAQLNEELENRVTQRTESLKQAIAQMEEFSYSVSHDLRGPVRAMQAYAKAVIEDYASRLDDKALGYLQRIVRSGERMDKLILDLLTYSKIARDKIEIRSTALGALIQDIIQQYAQMQSPKAYITIRNPIMDVMAHESSLTQALSNLLVNAVKFVAPGTIPEVEIRTEQCGKNVRLWIQDNGIGIEFEHQARLFGMFERANQDTRYEGTGIGLAIVRKAIERMGGSVGYQANAKTGSSFWIELPGVPA